MEAKICQKTMKTRRSCDCPDEKAIRPTNSLKSSQMTQRFPNLATRRVGRAQGRSARLCLAKTSKFRLGPKVEDSRRAQMPLSILYVATLSSSPSSEDQIPSPSSLVPFESSGSPVRRLYQGPVSTVRLRRQNCPFAATDYRRVSASVSKF
jgi:hypothetical protein